MKDTSKKLYYFIDKRRLSEILKKGLNDSYGWNMRLCKESNGYYKYRLEIDVTGLRMHYTPNYTYWDVYVYSDETNKISPEKIRLCLDHLDTIN